MAFHEAFRQIRNLHLTICAESRAFGLGSTLHSHISYAYVHVRKQFERNRSVPAQFNKSTRTKRAQEREKQKRSTKVYCRYQSNGTNCILRFSHVSNRQNMQILPSKTMIDISGPSCRICCNQEPQILKPPYPQQLHSRQIIARKPHTLREKRREREVTRREDDE